jgi:membrane protease YdiL (CAAX protease family)
VGQWWLLGVVVVLIVFNYLVGEELIFRGIWTDPKKVDTRLRCCG